MRSLLVLIVLIFLMQSVSGQNALHPNKTFKDTTFEVGDVLLAPKIVFYMGNGGRYLPEYQDSVCLIADFLMQNPALKVEIATHTDIRGASEFNDSLSLMRAKRIVDGLIFDFNIPKERLVARGYGERIPVIPCFIIEMVISRMVKEYLYSLNRRVTLRVLLVG
jgi:outer membrane protein OmpA-like peptidoglycan-associated protein